MLQHSGTHATSCLSTLYVKWLESAGARVAPIRYDLPAIELRALLSSLNGALITGGEIDITSLASPYMQAAGTLYGYALERHAASEVWPLWGTCMGLQVLSILGAGSSDVLARRAYHTNLLLPLSLTPAAQHSRMLCSPTNAPACEAPVAAAAVATLTTRNVTVNLNHDGIPPSAFAYPNGSATPLGRAFRLLSIGSDRRGAPFATAVEATSAYIWATQWHPERPQFQWGDEAAKPWGDFFDHGPDAVAAMWAVASFFVGWTRRSTHHFASAQAEAQALVYNYEAVGDTSAKAYVFG